MKAKCHSFVFRLLRLGCWAARSLAQSDRNTKIRQLSWKVLPDLTGWSDLCSRSFARTPDHFFFLSFSYAACGGNLGDMAEDGRGQLSCFYPLHVLLKSDILWEERGRKKNEGEIKKMLGGKRKEKMAFLWVGERFLAWPIRAFLQYKWAYILRPKRVEKYILTFSLDGVKWAFFPLILYKYR